MYKNFNLTESEKEQILNMHKDKGYGKKLREGDDETYFARHGEGNVVWTGSSNKTYKDLPDGDYDDETYDDFDSLHTTYPEFHSHYSGKGNVDRAKSMFDTYKRSQGPLLIKKRRVQNEQSQINERIYDKEYDVVRGNPDFKTQTGRPIGNYVNKRNAAYQFQQDFQNEFPDPGKEVRPYWEKDKAMPSGDSEIDTEIKRDTKVGDRWDVSKKWYGKPDPRDSNLPAEEEPKAPDVFQKYQKLVKKEELDSLERKIIALRKYKEEFGLDERMTQIYNDLLIKYREESTDFNEGDVK
jgi:hypothetical protein